MSGDNFVRKGVILGGQQGPSARDPLAELRTGSVIPPSPVPEVTPTPVPAESRSWTLQTPPTSLYHIALALGLVGGFAMVALPRFSREGRTLRSMLVTYDEIEHRFAPEELNDRQETSDSSETPYESPLEALLNDAALWTGMKSPPKRAAPKKQVAKISKERAASVIASLAYASPVDTRPGTKGFQAVRDQVARIIRSHARKGTDVNRLASAIVSESRRQNYDPLFVAAVIKSESAFNTLATSHVGAKGLMQIMPATGRYVASFEDFEGVPRGDLTDAGYNLRLGIRYLKYLEAHYRGNRVLTLIAYNWGPGHVDKTVKGEKRGVPRSVMNYALKILSDHNRWAHEITARG